MRRQRSKTHSAASQPRPARRIDEKSHDTYGTREKPAESLGCPQCGVHYRDGRWIWGSAPFPKQGSKCPACRRIEDDYPAGIVTLAGGFTTAHREEIENLIRNLEQHEKAEHPLNRIFSIDAAEGGLSVRTTDARLARSIGRALFHAYRGELDEPAPQSEGLIRIHWTRD